MGKAIRSLLATKFSQRGLLNTSFALFVQDAVVKMHVGGTCFVILNMARTADAAVSALRSHLAFLRQKILNESFARRQRRQELFFASGMKYQARLREERQCRLSHTSAVRALSVPEAGIALAPPTFIRKRQGCQRRWRLL